MLSEHIRCAVAALGNRTRLARHLIDLWAASHMPVPVLLCVNDYMLKHAAVLIPDNLFCFLTLPLVHAVCELQG